MGAPQQPRRGRAPTPTEEQDARRRQARASEARDTELDLEPPSFEPPRFHSPLVEARKHQTGALYALSVRLMGLALTGGLFLAPALFLRMQGAKATLGTLFRHSMPVSLAFTVLTLGILRSTSRMGLLAVPLSFVGGLWACDALGIGKGLGPSDLWAKVARPHELLFSLLWKKYLVAYGPPLLWAALGAGAAVAFLWQFAIRPALAPKPQG
jgi:hypothetical protein